MITPKIEFAEYVDGYTIHLKFSDGTEGNVDLTDELWGEVFEPLKNPQVFRDFRIDNELNTITWPSGADLAPEFLYEKAATRQNATTESGG